MRDKDSGYWAFIGVAISTSSLLQEIVDAVVEAEKENIEREKREQLCPDIRGNSIRYIDKNNLVFDRLFEKKWMYKSKRVRKMERQRELGMI